MATEKLIGLLNTRRLTAEIPDAMSEMRLRWTEALGKPLWYQDLQEELNTLVFTDKSSDARLRWLRKQFILTVGCALQEGRISLADIKEFESLDAEREPISNLVIHHTEGSSQATPEELNTLGFLLQYTKDFSSGLVLGQHVDGKPIGSGHLVNGRQVFFAYHWLINDRGDAIRLLDDKHIGWHAGNWSVNRRSVGIALAGNFDEHLPPECQLQGLVDLIKTTYPSIESRRIYGHYQVNFNKTCPGVTFAKSWKTILLERLGGGGGSGS